MHQGAALRWLAVNLRSLCAPLCEGPASRCSCAHTWLPHTWPRPHTPDLPTSPAPPLAGLLYTAAPRGEVTGTAEFVDAQNGLTAVVRFGRVEDGPPHCTLLQRPDALSGCIYRTLPSSPVAVVGDSGAGGVPGWQMPSPPASDKVRGGGACSSTRWPLVGAATGGQEGCSAVPLSAARRWKHTT